MRLKVTLPSEKTITANNKTVTASEFIIERTIDVPRRKAVLAVIKDLGKVKVVALCGDNYNNPEWTDESLVQALVAQFSA